jgi:hypothetical protein
MQICYHNYPVTFCDIAVTSIIKALSILRQLLAKTHEHGFAALIEYPKYIKGTAMI